MKPTHIIIHHSLTKDSGTVSWQAIRRYHIGECAWDDIGYHFGIELVQDVRWAAIRFETMLGRLPNLVGAHANGWNDRSIGICCVGNFDKDAPHPDQWWQCLNLVRWLMDVYAIPEGNVLGHREAAAGRTCPGKWWDMERFRTEL